MSLFSPKGSDGAEAETGGHDTLTADDLRGLARRCDKANPGVMTPNEEVIKRNAAGQEGRN